MNFMEGIVAVCRYTYTGIGEVMAMPMILFERVAGAAARISERGKT